MLSAVVIGHGKLAEVMAKMLCSSGTPVAVLGGKQKTQQNIEAMLQAEVEEAIPFQFIDDLRVKFIESSISERRRKTLLIFIETDSILLRTAHSFIPFATVARTGDVEISDSQHVSLHLYDPIEITKIAQIRSSSSTDPSSLARVRGILQKVGIVEVNTEQGDNADRMLNDWRAHEGSTPSLEKMLATVIPGRQIIDHNHHIMH
uniref:Shikimate_DH domain-containing protein n=1 Tax=Heterorhabditis bacteriophora TaxID=37862 RepID=A0A1I7XBF1_HETBA